MRFLKSSSLPVILAAFLLSSCKQDLDTTILSKRNVVLDGSQEVPAKPGAGNGTMDYDYNKTTRTLTFTVRWNSLTGPVTVAHIHASAQRGFNASPVQDYSAVIPKTQAGTYSNSLFIDGVKLTEEDLLRGGFYLNLHTAVNPGGEIRGQIEF